MARAMSTLALGWGHICERGGAHSTKGPVATVMLQISHCFKLYATQGPSQAEVFPLVATVEHNINSERDLVAL